MPGISVVSKDDTTINKDGKTVLVTRNASCRATQLTPRWDRLTDPKEPLAIDLEFQIFRISGAVKWCLRIGRVAIVNSRLETVYDTFVQYDYDEETEVRVNPRFGVDWPDLEREHGATTIKDAEEHLAAILKGRIIVGHGMHNDLKAMAESLWNKAAAIIDTQQLYGKVALGTLVKEHLSLPDFKAHDPTDDAKATMMLYLLRHPYTFTVKQEDFPSLGNA